MLTEYNHTQQALCIHGKKFLAPRHLAIFFTTVHSMSFSQIFPRQHLSLALCQFFFMTWWSHHLDPRVNSKIDEHKKLSGYPVYQTYSVLNLMIPKIFGSDKWVVAFFFFILQDFLISANYILDLNAFHNNN